MFDQHSPVGVLDSGIGGFSVVRQVQRLLPGENLLYFGDGAHIPYGNHGEKTIAITSGKAYAPVGGEGEAVSGTEKLVNPSAASVQLDGEETALALYAIRGSNYCSLASLSAMGLQGSWDAGSGTVTIAIA